MCNSSLRFLSFLVTATAGLLGVAACSNTAQRAITSAEASAVGRTALSSVLIVETASNVLNNPSTSGSNSYASLTRTHAVAGNIATDNWTIILSGYVDAGSAYSVSGTLDYYSQNNSNEQYLFRNHLCHLDLFRRPGCDGSFQPGHHR